KSSSSSCSSSKQSFRPSLSGGSLLFDLSLFRFPSPQETSSGSSSILPTFHPSILPTLPSERATKPFRNRLGKGKGFFVAKLCESSEGIAEIVVVKNQDNREYLHRGLEIFNRPPKSTGQFLRGDVVPAL